MKKLTNISRPTYLKLLVLGLSLIGISMLTLQYGEKLINLNPSFFICFYMTLLVIGTILLMYLLVIEEKYLYEYRIVQTDKIFEGSVLRTVYSVEQLKYYYVSDKSKWVYVDYFLNLNSAETLVNKLKSETKEGVITKETIICTKEQ